jgi:hypothetical protein
MVSRTPRDAPAHVPLWRDALQTATELRPAVAELQAKQSGIPYISLAFSLLLVAAASVGGAIVLYRRGLELARMARAPQLRGEPIVALAQFFRPRMIQVTWQTSASALGCALALWLIFFAIPRTRRASLWVAFIPGLLGAGGWLYYVYWLQLQQ